MTTMTKTELTEQSIALLRQRTATQIKIRRLNIELQDIESALFLIDGQIAAAPGAQHQGQPRST